MKSSTFELGLNHPIDFHDPRNFELTSISPNHLQADISQMYTEAAKTNK